MSINYKNLDESVKEYNNFFDNFDLVRENGLSQKYFNRDKFAKTGVWSGYRADINNADIENEILDKIESFYNRKIVKCHTFHYHINPWVSRQGFPHSDIRHSASEEDKSTNFAAIIYLNKDHQLPPLGNYGTTVYNRLGDIPIVDDDKMRIMYETNLEENNRFKDMFSIEVSMLKSVLEVYKHIKFEYNKLVLYPSIVLHSPDFYFGQTVENSRMTIAIHGVLDAN